MRLLPVAWLRDLQARNGLAHLRHRSRDARFRAARRRAARTALEGRHPSRRQTRHSQQPVEPVATSCASEHHQGRLSLRIDAILQCVVCPSSSVRVRVSTAVRGFGCEHRRGFGCAYVRLAGVHLRALVDCLCLCVSVCVGLCVLLTPRSTVVFPSAVAPLANAARCCSFVSSCNCGLRPDSRTSRNCFP